MRGANLPSAVMSTPLFTGCSEELRSCERSVPSKAPETPGLPKKLLIEFTIPEPELFGGGVESVRFVCDSSGVDAVSNDCGI